jgi:periplasmic protein TonB
LGLGEVVPQKVADPVPVPRADSAPRADAPVQPEAPAPEVERAAEVMKPAPAERAAVPEAPSGSGRKVSAAGGGGTPEVSAGAAKSLLADWGGSLRRKVERARRSPAGAEGQTGKVTLRLSVAVSGKVLGVAILRSSGVAALDKAAVDAVRRAGRLPKAPKGLGAASYDFNLPVVFTK